MLFSFDVVNDANKERWQGKTKYYFFLQTYQNRVNSWTFIISLSTIVQSLYKWAAGHELIGCCKVMSTTSRV